MRKHLIFAKLFDTGGSNASLRLLIKAIGSENVILIVEDNSEITFLKDIDPSRSIQTKVFKNLHSYAHLEYRFISNVKEFLKIIWSLIRLIFLCIKWHASTITISAVEPEKHLYFFWLPFIKVRYLLHTVPKKKYTVFTSFTCNLRLGDRKKLIVVSHFMKGKVIKAWDIRTVHEEAILVIHNCIDKSPFFTPRRYGMDTKRTIVTIGRLDDNKNPDIWLKVAQAITARYQNTSFIWIGNGNNLKIYNDLSKNQEGIKFIGYQANPENWLKEAFIYYQPSKMESHGIAVIEAMCWNLPCIVSNRGGLPESVIHRYNGLLVDPLDFEGHIIAIEHLLNNKVRAFKMGQNSIKRFNKLFTFQIFTEKVKSLYGIN